MQKTLRYKITGLSPLIMHNIELLNKRSEIGRELSSITAKRKNKTEEDEDRLRELEFLGGLYYDKKIGPYISAISIESCIAAGASAVRKGKAVKAGLQCIGDKYALEYDGPRKPSELWEKGFYDIRAVVVQRSRVLRTRPKFNQWASVFDVAIDDKVIGQNEVTAALTQAGSTIGIGDFRPRFGRFEVEQVNG
jgi:hypothetical protein